MNKKRYRFLECMRKARKSQEKTLSGSEVNGLHPLLVAVGDTDPLPVIEIKGLEGKTKREILEHYEKLKLRTDDRARGEAVAQDTR